VDGRALGLGTDPGSIHVDNKEENEKLSLKHVRFISLSCLHVAKIPTFVAYARSPAEDVPY
jgi:hypothetical protein